MLMNHPVYRIRCYQRLSESFAWGLKLTAISQVITSKFKHPEISLQIAALFTLVAMNFYVGRLSYLFSDVVLESKRRSMSADPLPQVTSTCPCDKTQAAATPGSVNTGIKGQADERDYGRLKNVKLKPTVEGYETVVSSFFRKISKFPLVLIKISVNKNGLDELGLIIRNLNKSESSSL